MLTKLLLCSIIALSFLSGCSITNASEEPNNTEDTLPLSAVEVTYQDYVKTFDNITTNDLSAFDSNDGYFLYTGRVTCPYCLSFVPELYSVSSKSSNDDISIKYLNSENEKDLGLEEFREKYEIQYVPNFSYFEGDKLLETMNITNETTSVEIQQFIDSMN